MKDIKYVKTILIAVFLIVVLIRIDFAMQTNQFSSDEAYFNLRQIEHIKETGVPLYDDPLSYSGRNLLFMPLFQYILSFFALFLPLIYVAKIIPNIFAASLIFVVYLIINKITKDRTAALITAILSGFIPIYFSETINTLSVYSFVIPLAFLLVYFFMTIDQKNHTIYFILTFAAYLFTHPSIIIIIICFLVYLFFAKIEALNQKKEELEIILFSMFVCLWAMMIFYKKIFIFHGISFIWQNVPTQLFNQYFSNISMFTIVNKIGLVSFLVGIYVIYQYILRKKDNEIYFLISMTITLLILIYSKLMTLTDGMLFLSVVMIMLLGIFIKDFIDYVNRTKFEKYFVIIIFISFILVFLTMITPAVIYAQNNVDSAFTQDEVNALIWIRDNTDKDSAVAAFPEQGNFITSISKRKNIIDSHYLLIPDIDERYSDVNRIYTTKSVIEAIDLLDKYSAKYIYFSTDRLIKNYGIVEIKYLDDKCFVPVYVKNKVMVYELRCIVKQT